jgi:hydrogenase nickel incorporation protein HypA/HybF
MHELSIALSLVEQIEKAAREQNALAVRRIRLTIGCLSGVDPEALRAAFPLAAAETIVAAGELDVEVIAVRVHCRGCGERSEPEAPFLYCGACGGGEVDVEAGRELLIQSIEVDVDTNAPIG